MPGTLSYQDVGPAGSWCTPATGPQPQYRSPPCPRRTRMPSSLPACPQGPCLRSSGQHREDVESLQPGSPCNWTCFHNMCDARPPGKAAVPREACSCLEKRDQCMPKCLTSAFETSSYWLGLTALWATYQTRCMKAGNRSSRRLPTVFQTFWVIMHDAQPSYISARGKGSMWRQIFQSIIFRWSHVVTAYHIRPVCMTVQFTGHICCCINEVLA